VSVVELKVDEWSAGQPGELVQHGRDVTAAHAGQSFNSGALAYRST
jgi:hypothetical protein